MPLYGSIWISVWNLCMDLDLDLDLDKKPCKPCKCSVCFDWAVKTHYVLWLFASQVRIWLEVCISSNNFTRASWRWLYKKHRLSRPRDAAETSARARPDRVPLSSEVRTLNARRMLREQVWNPYPRPWLWESHTWSNMHTLLQWARTHADSIYIL